MDGIENHLSKLEHLKFLNINVADDKNMAEVANLIVHSAGKVPNLQSFDFDDFLDSSTIFVKQYAELYPTKKLQVKDMRSVLEFKTREMKLILEGNETI
jgi:hypothetical protein